MGERGGLLIELSLLLWAVLVSILLFIELSRLFNFASYETYFNCGTCSIAFLKVAFSFENSFSKDFCLSKDFSLIADCTGDLGSSF
jgi:hypothetical protein